MRTGVVVLNWNNAGDTIECSESVLQSVGADFILYLIDNGSGDDSVEVLRQWACHRVGPEKLQLCKFLVARRDWEARPKHPHPGDVVLGCTDGNLGYAGGNNIAIRLALEAGCAAVWILNNDTRVASDTLACLERAAAASPFAGVIGACVLEYDRPDIVQCLGGGQYNWYLSKNTLVGYGMHVKQLETLNDRLPRLDYISGASMFIPSETIQRVGLLSEEYFLYYEELDYAERCRRHGRTLAVSLDAKVWHKFGASLGSSIAVDKKSTKAAYYAARSAVMFTRKFRPWLLPSVVPARIGWAGRLAIGGHNSLAIAAIKGTLAGLMCRGNTT